MQIFSAMTDSFTAALNQTLSPTQKMSLGFQSRRTLILCDGDDLTINPEVSVFNKKNWTHKSTFKTTNPVLLLE